MGHDDDGGDGDCRLGQKAVVVVVVVVLRGGGG